MRRKTRYLILTVEDDIGSFPLFWNQLPEKIIESCPSSLIRDIKCFSATEGRLKRDSVLYFTEVEKKEAEKLKDSGTWIEDKKNKLIYILLYDIS